MNQQEAAELEAQQSCNVLTTMTVETTVEDQEAAQTATSAQE